MAEWSNAADSKSVVALASPGVRIPLSPLSSAEALAKADSQINGLCMWFVYLLRCANGDIYKGCTENLEERLERHHKGYVDATKNNLPVQIITYIAFDNKYKAFEFEKYLKSGSGRAFTSKHLI